MINQKACNPTLDGSITLNHVPKKNYPTVAVIGAGLGGLATALRLKKMGLRVIIFEKNPQVGGKLSEFRENSYRWDMGPSLLTMPFILDELFDELSLHRIDWIRLRRISPTCRYFWEDGYSIDEDDLFWSRPEVSPILKNGESIYTLSGDAFLRYPPHAWWRALRLKNIFALRHLLKLAPWRTLHESLQKLCIEPHMRQLFERFATYNGSSPYYTPSTFNVIPYVEAKFGGWYVEGGMAQLTRQLGRIAEQMGISICTNTSVKKLDEKGLHLSNGSIERFNFYICNGDVLYAHKHWIRFSGYEKALQILLKRERSLSGFIMLLGVRRQFPFLSHHNIFFSSNYEREFRELFAEKIPVQDPTIYISITSRSNAKDAPNGCDNYFILVNAPSNTESIDWPQIALSYQNHILKILERKGLCGLREAIETSYVFTPLDFENRDQSLGGSLYGWASHNLSTSFLRPSIRSNLNSNLYFTGGTTHPGGGIPLVLLNAQMVAEEIGGRIGCRA